MKNLFHIGCPQVLYSFKQLHSENENMGKIYFQKIKTKYKFKCCFFNITFNIILLGLDATSLCYPLMHSNLHTIRKRIWPKHIFSTFILWHTQSIIDLQLSFCYFEFIHILLVYLQWILILYVTNYVCTVYICRTRRCVEYLH